MTNDSQIPEIARCRLCDGALNHRFALIVLRTHHVNYFACQKCGSLQTERPYWLDEAYASNLSELDTGSVQRNLQNLAACLSVATIFRLKNTLDFGGGDGLLCRLLRDYSLNCFVQDGHAQPKYAQGFLHPNFAIPDLVVCFEVVEHFANPAIDMRQILDRGASVVLASTSIYQGQGSDWWYLSAESGQHVFFYSADALKFCADQYGYSVTLVGNFVLFTKVNITHGWIKSALARIALNRSCCRLVRAFIAVLPTPGVWTDRQAVLRGQKS